MSGPLNADVRWKAIVTITRRLHRKGEGIDVPAPLWAGALELALRHNWKPVGTAASCHSTNWSASDQQAEDLANALERAFETALSRPINFYPVQVDMGQLYIVKEFVSGGAFEVSDT